MGILACNCGRLCIKIEKYDTVQAKAILVYACGLVVASSIVGEGEEEDFKMHKYNVRGVVRGCFVRIVAEKGEEAAEEAQRGKGLVDANQAIRMGIMHALRLSHSHRLTQLFANCIKSQP